MNKRLVAVFAFAVSLALGCGGAKGSRGPAELVPVEGKLTSAGTPVTMVMIQFVPVAGNGTPVLAFTDQNGHYQLKQKDGSAHVASGEYRVSAFFMGPSAPRRSATATSSLVDLGQVRVTIGQGRFDFDLQRPPRNLSKRR